MLFLFKEQLAVAVLLASEFINFLVHGSSKYAKILLDNILLFADDIFDPNFKHRETFLERVNCMLQELS